MYFYKKLHFSPFSRRTTGTQCLPRLRLTSGRDTPPADLRSGRAYGRPPVGTRLRQTSGRDAPTAFPTKANGEEFAFRSTGEALQKQANRFTKARKEEIHRSHTTSGKQQRKTQKDPALGIPGVGSLLFIREKPSPLFSISQWLPCSASRDVQHLTRTRSVFRAYGGHTVPSAPTADLRSGRAYGVP